MSIPARFILADLSGMPDDSLPRDPVNEWSLKSFDVYFTAVARHEAGRFARQATECEMTGRGVRQWHSCREAAVLSLLAAAEMAAPEGDRNWHACRLDAYVREHGLRGWYRHTDEQGKHAIQINLIRKDKDGNRGRYYTHETAASTHDLLRYWVIDRDTGCIVYRSYSAGVTQQWIDETELPSA